MNSDRHGGSSPVRSGRITTGNARAASIANNRRVVTAWIAIGLLVLAVLAIASLIATAEPVSFKRYPTPENDELPGLWPIAIWLIKKGAALNSLFAGIITIVTVGIAAAAEIYKHKLQILAIAILCLLGIGGCVYLLVLMDNGDRMGVIVYFTNLPGEQASAASNWFFGALIGWFTAFLAAQLGISLVSNQGAFRAAAGSPSASGPPPAAPTTPAGGGDQTTPEAAELTARRAEQPGTKQDGSE